MELSDKNQSAASSEFVVKNFDRNVSWTSRLNPKGRAK